MTILKYLITSRSNSNNPISGTIKMYRFFYIQILVSFGQDPIRNRGQCNKSPRRPYSLCGRAIAITTVIWRYPSCEHNNIRTIEKFYSIKKNNRIKSKFHSSFRNLWLFHGCIFMVQSPRSNVLQPI